MCVGVLRVYRSPCEVLKNRKAWGRNDLLSLSVEQESDKSVIEAASCLEMTV